VTTRLNWMVTLR